MKTDQVAEKIGPSVKNLKDNIEIAFIFGAVASGYDDDTSEKNLVVIGDLKKEELEAAVIGVKKELTEELAVNLFTRDEYVQQFLAGKIFIRKSANAPKIFFVGTDADLWHLYYDA